MGATQAPPWKSLDRHSAVSVTTALVGGILAAECYCEVVKNHDFARNLIKGRIAELIFEQMLRDAQAFTVLAFGYENVLPELAHRQQDMHVAETMEVIRRAPDFAVINNDTHDVHLIEVKYMRNMTASKVLLAAERMYHSWKPSYLFVATPEGFFFGAAKQIVAEKGMIHPLEHQQIPADLQERYIDLLNEFLPPEGTIVREPAAIDHPASQAVASPH